MIISTIAEFCIQYDLKLGLLRAEWLNRHSTKNLREAFGKLLKLFNQLRVTTALLELDRLPDVSVYDQLWLSTNFVPGLAGLSLQRLVIILSSNRVYNSQVVESLLTTARPLIRCDIQFFTQPTAALHWLTDDAPHLPALLTEWEQTCGSSSASNTRDAAEPLSHREQS